MSTPTKPPGTRLGNAWNNRTLVTANARRPSMSGRYWAMALWPGAATSITGSGFRGTKGLEPYQSDRLPQRDTTMHSPGHRCTLNFLTMLMQTEN